MNRNTKTCKLHNTFKTIFKKSAVYISRLKQPASTAQFAAHWENSAFVQLLPCADLPVRRCPESLQRAGPPSAVAAEKEAAD